MTALQCAERLTIDDLRADLRKADSSRAGELERGDFARVLSRFGFKMSPADERHLTDSLGEGRAGIDYIDFCDALKQELERGEMRDEMRVEMREGRQDASLDDVLERLKKRISRDLKHGKSLSDEFHAMDTNGDGELSVAEIERGMDRLGLPLTREESIKLVRRFPGSSKTESIYFKDFVKYMSGAVGLDREETINELVDRIQRIVEDRLGSSSNAAATLKRVFEDMDDNGDGRLSESEFRRAMSDMKVRLLSLFSLFSLFSLSSPPLLLICET
jgi:Ca2+-binding EF-hand superfamily protein